MDDERLLRAGELAVLLGVAVSSIYKMASAKVIPVVEIGERKGGLRFSHRAVMDALAKPVAPRKAESEQSARALAGVEA